MNLTHWVARLIRQTIYHPLILWFARVLHLPATGRIPGPDPPHDWGHRRPALLPRTHAWRRNHAVHLGEYQTCTSSSDIRMETYPFSTHRWVSDLHFFLWPTSEHITIQYTAVSIRSVLFPRTHAWRRYHSVHSSEYQNNQYYFYYYVKHGKWENEGLQIGLATLHPLSWIQKKNLTEATNNWQFSFIHTEKKLSQGNKIGCKTWLSHNKIFDFSI